MNDFKISALFVFFMSLCLVACQSTTVEKTAREGLKKGEALTYQINVNSENRGGKEGQEVTSIMKQEQAYEFIVKEILDNGATQMDFILKDMKMNMSNTVEGDPVGEAVVFDTKIKEESENPTFDLLQKLTDYPYKMIYDANGKILSITGVEARIDTILKEMTTPGAQQFMMQMKAFMNEKAMKIQLNELMGHLTVGKEVGDSWETSDTISLLPTTKSQLAKKYTLKERQDGKVTLGINGTINVDPNSTVTMGLMKFRYDIKGTLEGEMVIEEKNGWVISSTTQQIMSGKMIGSGPNIGGEETVNFYASTDAKIERL